MWRFSGGLEAWKLLGSTLALAALWRQCPSFPALRARSLLQLLLGVARLVPTPSYFPLRLRWVERRVTLFLQTARCATLFLRTACCACTAPLGR